MTSGHAARHEASRRHLAVVIHRPDHGASNAIGNGDDGIVRHIDPDAVEPHTIMTATGLPVHIGERRAIGVRATGSLATFQAIEPCFQLWIASGIAAVVAGMPETGPGRRQQYRSAD